MKKIFGLISISIICTIALAQSPNIMSYQAVIRNASGNLVSSTSVGIQISILQSSATGTAVYIETHTPSTNANGLVSIEIGNGTAVTGSFSGIDWSNGPYFIKTETDPSGGTTYSIAGTSQLLSVPYAQYASNVENIDDADADPNNEIQALSISNDTVYLENGGFVVLPQEADPMFNSSVAAGISSVDTANYNNHTIEIDGSVTNEIQTLSISNDTISLSNNGGSIKLPENPAYNSSVLSRGSLPTGAGFSSGGSYTAASTSLSPGIYIYTLYGCSGQLGQTGSGITIDVVFVTGSGTGSGTWRDTRIGGCGHYHTGVIRVTAQSNVAVKYTSYIGSTMSASSNGEIITFYQIY